MPMTGSRYMPSAVLALHREHPSSRLRRGPTPQEGLSLAPLSSGRAELFELVSSEGLKDGIGEAAFQYAHCLTSAVAGGSAAFDHGLGWWMPPGLGERDPVQRGVELAVAGAAEPVPGLVRRPHRQGRRAVVPCVSIAGLGPFNAGGLAEDLGRGQGAAAGDGE